jgi:hypothetical protein
VYSSATFEANTSGSLGCRGRKYGEGKVLRLVAGLLGIMSSRTSDGSIESYKSSVDSSMFVVPLALA